MDSNNVSCQLISYKVTLLRFFLSTIFFLTLHTNETGRFRIWSSFSWPPSFERQYISQSRNHVLHICFIFMMKSGFRCHFQNKCFHKILNHGTAEVWLKVFDGLNIRSPVFFSFRYHFFVFIFSVPRNFSAILSFKSTWGFEVWLLSTFSFNYASGCIRRAILRKKWLRCFKIYLDIKYILRLSGSFSKQKYNDVAEIFSSYHFYLALIVRFLSIWSHSFVPRSACAVCSEVLCQQYQDLSWEIQCRLFFCFKLFK